MPDPTAGPLGYDDIFSTAIQGIPSTPDRQLALAQSLRAQNLLGNLGLATGDRVLGPEGKSLIGQSDTGLQDIARERNEDLQRAQLKEYHDAMLAQKEQLGTLYEQGRNTRAGAHEAAATDRTQIMADARKASANLTRNYLEDPDVQDYASKYALVSGVPPAGTPGKTWAIVQGLKRNYPEMSMDDLVTWQVSNGDAQVGEKARLRKFGSIAAATEQGGRELKLLAPQLGDDIDALGNTQFKGLNWLINIPRDQLNSVALQNLQTDLMRLHNAYFLVSGRGGTSLQERLLAMNHGRDIQDSATLKAVVAKFVDEANIAEQANEGGRAPRIGGLPGAVPRPGGVGGVPPPGNGSFVPFAPGQPRPPLNPQVQPGAAPASPAAPGQQLRPDDLAPAGMPGAPGVAPQRALPNALRQQSPQPAPAPPQAGAPPPRAFPNTLGAPPAAPGPQAAPQNGPNPAVAQMAQQILQSHGIRDLKAASDSQLQQTMAAANGFTMGTDSTRNDAVRMVGMAVTAEIQRRAQMKQGVQQEAQKFEKPTKHAADYLRDAGA